MPIRSDAHDGMMGFRQSVHAMSTSCLLNHPQFNSSTLPRNNYSSYTTRTKPATLSLHTEHFPAHIVLGES